MSKQDLKHGAVTDLILKAFFITSRPRHMKSDCC